MGVENARPGVFGGVVVLFVGVVVIVFPFVFSGVWLCPFSSYSCAYVPGAFIWGRSSGQRWVFMMGGDVWRSVFSVVCA